jgi:hypothetical protein
MDNAQRDEHEISTRLDQATTLLDPGFLHASDLQGASKKNMFHCVQTCRGRWSELFCWGVSLRSDESQWIFAAVCKWCKSPPRICIVHLPAGHRSGKYEL